MTSHYEFDAADFADHLAAMGDDELFRLMAQLEKQSEDIRPEYRNTSDIFGKIALVESAIEDRFPGQILAPYKDWRQRQPDL
ncbi:hypothetical protein [Rhizobium leguminosarum]|uniref:hypothetical protein n=1 Tax=Rhizobium leguminosarum TaxID=384 RepID=UPI003CFE5B37